ADQKVCGGMVPGPRRSHSHRGVREVPGRLGFEDDLPREDAVRHFRLQGLVCGRHVLGRDERAGRHKHLLRRDSQPPERTAADLPTCTLIRTGGFDYEHYYYTRTKVL